MYGVAIPNMDVQKTVSFSKNAYFPEEIVEISIDKTSSGLAGNPISVYISHIPLINDLTTWEKRAEFDSSFNARFISPTTPGLYALATNDGGQIHISGIFSVTETPINTLIKGSVLVGIGAAIGVVGAISAYHFIFNRKKSN